jgi:hypothetical protein
MEKPNLLLHLWNLTAVLNTEEGRVASGITFRRTGSKKIPALKVPRRCPRVLVAAHLREGKALGSGLSYEQRREVEQELYCV